MAETKRLTKKEREELLKLKEIIDRFVKNSGYVEGRQRSKRKESS